MPRQNYDNRADQPMKQHVKFDKIRKRWKVCDEADAQVTLRWSEKLKSWVTAPDYTKKASANLNWYHVAKRQTRW